MIARGLSKLGRVFAVALVISLIAAPVWADNRVAELTRSLASRSDKTRLSAVLALAKLGDPAALKPLVSALNDPSDRVRAVAATALGRLEHSAALPRLRALASDDSDPEVRQAASNAVIKIVKANHQRDERARLDARVEAKPKDAEARRAPAAGHALSSDGAGDDVFELPHPDLFVLINSSSDESPGNADKKTREIHAQIIKRVLIERLKTDTSVTSVAEQARRWNLEARHIDLSVTRLATTVTAGILEIDAQLRIAISDDSGKMLSFLSGGAKVTGRNGKLDAQYLPALRREALENAMRGMFDKLLAHLHQPPS